MTIKIADRGEIDSFFSIKIADRGEIDNFFHQQQNLFCADLVLSMLFQTLISIY